MREAGQRVGGCFGGWNHALCSWNANEFGNESTKKVKPVWVLTLRQADRKNRGNYAENRF